MSVLRTLGWISWSIENRAAYLKGREKQMLIPVSLSITHFHFTFFFFFCILILSWFCLQFLVKNEDFLSNHGEAWGVCEIENKRTVRPLGSEALISMTPDPQRNLRINLLAYCFI